MNEWINTHTMNFLPPTIMMHCKPSPAQYKIHSTTKCAFQASISLFLCEGVRT